MELTNLCNHKCVFCGYKDVEKLYEEFGAAVDKVYVFDCANQGGQMLDLIRQGIVKKGELLLGGSVPCAMCFNRLHITCEGYLSACCSDVDGYLNEELTVK